jgi:hypothetical protein
MGVDSQHPAYEEYVRDWTMMRDTESGENAIKDQEITYLPKPSGFSTQRDQGREMYGAYKFRAQFPDILAPTLAGMVGVIHRTEAQIDGMEEKDPLFKLWEKCTKDGLTLEAFHRRITTEVLLMGRFCILVDVPSETRGGKDLPYLTGYGAELLINWSEFERDLFVLDETRAVRDEQEEFTWNDEERYRVLRLRDGVYSEQVYDKEGAAGEEITPQMRGGKRLEEIPLVVVGPRDLSLEHSPPPLAGVARAALAIYRLDADYRHQLFFSGQETFCMFGEIDPVPETVGAGVILAMPTGADARYIGPAGNGIAALRTAILDERQNAVAAGVKLFDTQRQAESGEALRLRAAAQTATLTTVAISSAQALERALRYAAMFVGQNPEEIVVRPNLQFVEQRMTPREAADLIGVWQSGAISKATLYENLQRGEIASQERTFEEEEDMINEEQIDLPQMAAGGGGFGMPGQVPGGGKRAINGSGAPMPVPDRFVEDGEGLVIEPG